MARLTARLVPGVLVAFSAAALALACSASGGGSHFGGPGSGGSGNSSSGGSGNATGSGGSGNATGSGGSGNATGSGGSGAGYNLGGNGGGGNATGSGGTCGGDTYGGKQAPLDMYIMMDRSGSMDGTKWNGVKSAITSFVNAGAAVKDIGVGIQFFPPKSTDSFSCPLLPPCGNGCMDFAGICIPGTGSAECNISTYLPPPVQIQKLPGVASAIITAMGNNGPNGGGTPTLPAMQSAVQATTAYAKQNPSHKVIIVLATDGEPNDCNSTVSNVAQEAQKALASTPSVMTFVIGIGTVSNMDTIAKAGGSGTAIQVDAANANQQFLDAMNKIRGTALGCEYLIPTPTSGTFDPGLVNVNYTPDNGSPQLVYGVGDASKCGSGLGWYYDNPPPATPTKIILCPDTCKQVQGGGSVSIELGCKTKPPPVQ